MKTLAWNGGVCDEEVGMNWNFVGHCQSIGAIVAVGFSAAESDAAIQTIALARLDEEQFRFAGQRGASGCGEVAPHRFQFVMCVFGVDVTQFTMRQYCYP